jgi:hypothetical protein
MMGDFKLEEQIFLTAFNNIYETFCFFVGSALLTIGLFMSAFMPEGQWKNKGLTLIVSSTLIAYPAVMTMMMSLIGGNDDTFLQPAWLLNAISMFGVLYGVYGWLSESRKAKFTNQ